jgi:hypothetical protein
MTAQAASRVTKSHPAKKTAKSAENEDTAKDALYAVEEHSLSGFLENEPDLYTVADIKVRYRSKTPLKLSSSRLAGKKRSAIVLRAKQSKNSMQKNRSRIGTAKDLLAESSRR